MKALNLTVFFWLGLMTSLSWGAVSPNLAMPAPKNILQGDGGVQGGQAGKLTSLLDVRSSSTRNGDLERLVMDIGDGVKRKLQGRLGYYTVEIKGGRILVVSFRQSLNTNISDKDLIERMKKSKFISQARVLFEPTSQTTSVIFNLKRQAKVHAFSVSGAKDTGKLVLDLAPASKM